MDVEVLEDEAAAQAEVEAAEAFPRHLEVEEEAVVHHQAEEGLLLVVDLVAADEDLQG